MKKRTVLGLIVIMMAVCFQASALEVTASVVPTLKDVQYYEFGFSAGPVTDGNPQFISGGKLEFVPDIKINNGVVAVDVESQDIWAYWNVVSNAGVTINISATEFKLEGAKTYNDSNTIDWTVSTVDGNGNIVSTVLSKSYYGGDQGASIGTVTESSETNSDDIRLRVTLDKTDLIEKQGGLYNASLYLRVRVIS